VLVKVNIVHPNFISKSIVIHELGGNRYSWNVPVILLKSSDWNAHVHDVPPPPEDPPPPTPLTTLTLSTKKTTLLNRSINISLQVVCSKTSTWVVTTMVTSMCSRDNRGCSRIIFQCSKTSRWCNNLSMCLQPFTCQKHLLI
jgi:hypothetical protein